MNIVKKLQEFEKIKKILFTKKDQQILLNFNVYSYNFIIYNLLVKIYSFFNSNKFFIILKNRNK